MLSGRAGVESRIYRGVHCGYSFDAGESTSGLIDFKRVEGAYGGGHAFVEAVKIGVGGVKMEPGGVGGTAGAGGERHEHVFVLVFHEPQSGDVAGVRGDVEFLGGG